MKRRAFLSVFGALAALPALALTKMRGESLGEYRTVPWTVKASAVRLNEDWMARVEERGDERDFTADVERFIRDEVEPLARRNVSTLYGRRLA